MGIALLAVFMGPDYCRLPHEPLAPLLQGWADYWMLYFPYSASNKQELMPSLAGSA